MEVRSKITVSRKKRTLPEGEDAVDEVPSCHKADSSVVTGFAQVSVAEARASEIASKLREQARPLNRTKESCSDPEDCRFSS